MATSSTSSSRSLHWWVNAVSFVSVVILGIVLFCSVVFKWNGDIAQTLEKIANALAYVVVATCSFVYASGKLRKKNGIWYMIIWAGAVVLLTLYYIVPLVK